MRRDEQKKIQLELVDKYCDKLKNQWKEYVAGLDEGKREFIKDVEGYRWKKGVKSKYVKDFFECLKSGECKNPSDFVVKKLDWLFDGYIFPEYKEAMLFSLDHSNEFAYYVSGYGCSFRTKTYYMQNLYRIIYEFHNHMIFKRDICDVLELGMSEEENACVVYRYDSYNYLAIAYELNKGNQRLEGILTDIVNGDGKLTVDRTVIKGIIFSHNNKMHKLLGRLLLAARNQEGLRQLICETMDIGTEDAFLYLLKVIDENNLIRFSSVKRAVGVWLGLIDPESSNLERVSEKSVELIIKCITNKQTVEEFLQTEDSMKIYIALWSIAFSDLDEAISIVKKMTTSGTNHQVLVAGYFCDKLYIYSIQHKFAKIVIKSHSSELDIMAVYLVYFLEEWRIYGRESSTPTDKNLNTYFINENEACEYFDILMNLYNNIPKKGIDFSPCIFPWYQASLTKSDVIARLCLIARLLNDNEKIDITAKMIHECNANDRFLCLYLSLNSPSTSVQKSVLTEMLCDREKVTRGIAKDILVKLEIEPENYLQMEQMLKYKIADIRENVICFLYNQGDEALKATIKRLLADKKEERRAAGLDLVMQLKKDNKRQSLFLSCIDLVKQIVNCTSKEQILINNIIPSKNEDTLLLGQLNKYEQLHYSEKDTYVPIITMDNYILESINIFKKFFPSSVIVEQLETASKGKEINFDQVINKDLDSKLRTQIIEDCNSLEKCILDHIEDEFVGYGGEIYTIGDSDRRFREKISEIKYDIPLLDVWRKWYEDNVNDFVRLYRMHILLSDYEIEDEYTKKTKPYIYSLLGKEYEKYTLFKFSSKLFYISKRLIQDYEDSKTMKMLGIAAGYWYINCLPKDMVLIDRVVKQEEKNVYKQDFIVHDQLSELFSQITYENDDTFDTAFPLAVGVLDKTFDKEIVVKRNEARNKTSLDIEAQVTLRLYGYKNEGVFSRPTVASYIIAAYRGIITKSALYKFIFSQANIENAVTFLSNFVIAYREKEKKYSKRGAYWSSESKWQEKAITELVGEKTSETTDDDKKLLQFADSIYDEVINHILSDELKRGDSEAKYSNVIRRISRIYGMDNFITILRALGRETLERSICSYWYSTGKKNCLSHLLSVCVPAEGDNSFLLRDKLKQTDITDQRLIESALYSSEWITIVGEYLGWEGFQSACFYFMAHMNEQFDDKRKAVIAKYTPLSGDELNLGAFDIGWFWQAYNTLGKERFEAVYDAAKYISAGSKHARARKYADAVLGKMEKADIEEKVRDKRNKDLIMSYALIPLNGEEDIFSRYLFIQEFIKGSKKFGAQRIASEKAAAEIAMSNLATNAGYKDVTRLILQMETKLIEDSKELFIERDIEGVKLKLQMENEKINICCTKNDKILKSVPAKLKKNEYVVLLNDTKKRLTEQYRRTRIMFEEAMEEETIFKVSEIMMLHNNPVVYPIVKNLLFMSENRLGFLIDNKLRDYAGNEIILREDDQVKVAHPYDIYLDGHWAKYQKLIFDNKIVQSFKQVFRELYVKTKDELNMMYSRRYEGYQIQPKKTVACLKKRRWVADVEDGLQKVYYKDNIVARIFAMADWFTPSDIEAPTLQFVDFSDRKTGNQIEISKIPDIIFSEVMRDVDLAVSVAYAGGVDPETSHSTIEMRAALLGFTLPLFKLNNVKINNNHAIIEGSYGTYTVQLGSGVVHKRGGAMINILPVHSQHRGRIFLPFADDDPKTAEIITKVILLAEDKKIKDPTILEQIKM